MAYESPEELGAVKRGERASDPKGYGTAFEIGERRKDGATPDSQDGSKSFGWSGFVGLLIIGTAVAVGYHVLRKPKAEKE